MQSPEWVRQKQKLEQSTERLTYVNGKLPRKGSYSDNATNHPRVGLRGCVQNSWMMIIYDSMKYMGKWSLLWPSKKMHLCILREWHYAQNHERNSCLTWAPFPLTEKKPKKTKKKNNKKISSPWIFNRLMLTLENFICITLCTVNGEWWQVNPSV